MSNHGNIKKGLFLLLHISLLCSSLSGVCSKMASRYTDNIFSLQFIFWFGLVFVSMFGYAIIWRKLIFDERITWNMLLGACIIFAGIYLVTGSDGEENGGERV